MKTFIKGEFILNKKNKSTEITEMIEEVTPKNERLGDAEITYFLLKMKKTVDSFRNDVNGFYSYVDKLSQAKNKDIAITTSGNSMNSLLKSIDNTFSNLKDQMKSFSNFLY